MAEIRIQGPDGSSFSFPEGTAADVIQGALSAHYGGGKPEPAKPNAFIDSVKSYGQGVVDNIASMSELPQTVSELAMKGGVTGAEKIRNFIGIPFSDAEKKARDELFATQLPRPATALKEAAGLTYQPQTVPGEYAHTLGEFSTNAVTPGSALGKVAQVVVPALVSETAGQATKGTKLEPYARIASAILSGGGVAALDNALQPSAIPGLSRRAANYATETVADPSRRAALTQELQRLGPEAMLADVSPEWMGVARGAASRPGQRDAVVNALLDRHAGANARLGSDLNANLGPAPIPSRVEQGLEAGRAALQPEYGRALAGASPVDTRSLAGRLDRTAMVERGSGQRAAGQVRQMLDEVPDPNAPPPPAGTPPTGSNLDTNPATLLNTRQAIDGLLATEADPNTIRILTQARQEVDAELARQVPGIKDVDAQFAELSRQSEALTRGGQVLDGGKTAIRPVELADEITQGAQPQGTMVGPSAVPMRLAQGTRAEIDRVVGTNANDPAALQRLVKGEGDWNRDKLRLLFGQDRADTALNAIDRETTFARTGNRVAAGSDTAMAQRFGNFLDDTANPPKIPTDTTLTGALLRFGQKVVGGASEARAERKADRVASELGRLAVARGPERDAIIQSLTNALAERGMPLPRAGVVAALLAGRSAAEDQIPSTR